VYIKYPVAASPKMVHNPSEACGPRLKTTGLISRRKIRQITNGSTRTNERKHSWSGIRRMIHR